MTKEEAIERLNKIALNYGLSSDKIEALTMAIDALEFEIRLSKQSNMIVDNLENLKFDGVTSYLPSSVKQCGCLVNCNCDVNRPTFTANSNLKVNPLNCLKPYNPSNND